MTKLLPDMCTTTSLMCGTNDAKAEMELVSDNSSCTKKPGNNNNTLSNEIV